MQRVGGVEQLHQRARADRAGIVAFQHAAAEHVEAVAARHQIVHAAWMQQPDRPRELHIVAVQQQHLAAHPAQLRQAVAGGVATAVQHDAAVVGLAARIDAVADGDAQFAQPLRQRRQRGARVEVRLVGEQQAVAETSGHIRLQRGDAVAIQPLEAFAAIGERLQLADIARGRQHQRAVADGAGKLPRPPLQRLPAKLGDDGFGADAFAPRRQHAAGKPAGAIAAGLAAGFQHLHFRACLRQFQCRRQAAHAGAQHAHARAHAGRFAGASTYSAPPLATNSSAFACIPASAPPRSSWLSCIEQNFGPHIEQKCALLWASFGRVASW